MARSASVDPLEKFRFSITVISIDLSVTGALDALAAIAAQKLSVVTRAGFSEVVLPKVTVNEMSYRENIDNQRFSKGPGLAKYDPVILRRGVTSSFDLWNWYRLVNDDMALLGVAQELARDAKIAPVQSENFRKEVIINIHDREGNAVKQWILFNAFPVGYKGGNDLSANSEEKLVEELTLTYEFFLELKGGVGGFLAEVAKDAATGIVGAATQGLLPQFNPPNPPFSR